MFNKYPNVRIDGFVCSEGWPSVMLAIKNALNKENKSKKIVIVEIYPGVFEEDFINALTGNLRFDHIFRINDIYKNEKEIHEMVMRDLTDDPVFGKLSYLEIDNYFDNTKYQKLVNDIDHIISGTVLVLGTGASKAAIADILIYADMSRWEIQQRFRQNEISNLGIENKSDRWSWQYKWAFFVDWRVADRLKREIMNDWDFVLDSNDRSNPKLVEADAVYAGLHKAAREPFQLVPFFDPGPWGGQWMKKVFELDPDVENYAWCFNCVPEENSLLFNFDNTIFEIPAINLVFHQPIELLGEKVFARFGAEFPIRFDYLDTWEGGNLSLQVHPLTDYIQNNFGWHYTQDESYYLMDAKPGAKVFLGVKNGISSEKMINDLKKAQNGEPAFPVGNYVQSWSVKKHDHVLIPAGTVHCSGKDSVVLEISATPYIFTFKLWDWSRLGLDGHPRPVHIDHGKNVIQFNRTPSWTKTNLINRVEFIESGNGWTEERTGLHELEFIETRRHWFTKKVEHHTNNNVNVLNLVEGEEIIVESPKGLFEPMIVHYAETFVIPAFVGMYTIRPYGKTEGKKCATIKAFVRT